ncbi:putative xylogalacturonan beta-1,3-xylosyltransferase [Helianthus annuus]|nr:putative xylogalacturonan beta-1,3-xylosyltransferase [Helianthus annuus]
MCTSPTEARHPLGSAQLPRDDLFQFCLTIAGDTPSSNRFFDAIASHCVPVIISYDIELPFEDVLDYSKFSVFVQSSDAVKKGYLMKLLRGIKRQKWIQMWERLKKIALHFEY